MFTFGTRHAEKFSIAPLPRSSQISSAKSVSITQAAGTQLYLMSYPARHSWYGVANPVLRQAAEETSTPLIDLTALFEPLCPEGACPSLFLYDDNHPNAAGNSLIAEAVVKRLSPPVRP